MRAKRARAFLMEPATYLNDHAVLRMNTLERGAYSTLLFALWDLPEPGVVEDHPEVLRALSRTTPSEWDNVRVSVMAAFDTETRPGWWIQKRMVQDHHAQTLWVEAQKARGRMGGRPKRDNKLKPMGFDNGTQTKANTRNYVTGNSELQKKKTRSTRVERETDPGFARFYSAYPRKVGKVEAEKAWKSQKILSPEDLDRVMTGLERWQQHEWVGKERQFIPHPATWLRGRRWNDDPSSGSGNGAIVAPGASNAATEARLRWVETLRKASGRGET